MRGARAGLGSGKRAGRACGVRRSGATAAQAGSPRVPAGGAPRVPLEDPVTQHVVDELGVPGEDEAEASRQVQRGSAGQRALGPDAAGGVGQLPHLAELGGCRRRDPALTRHDARVGALPEVEHQRVRAQHQRHRLRLH
eukprot:scaffold30481_cov101-Isochrysis_galbana.AAC.1